MTTLAQMTKKLNNFFFMEEEGEVSTHDAIWFYGALAILAFFGVFALAIKLFNAFTL